MNRLVLLITICALYTIANAQDTITVVGVGDIMLGTDYPSSNYLPPNNSCNDNMADIIHYLQDADITFGNIEGAFAGKHGKSKHCNDPKKCFSFRMPVHFVNCIKEAGFDIVSTANNHANDFGSAGSKNTALVLDSMDITHAGHISKPSAIYKKNGLKIGFCAFSPHSATSSSKDYNHVKKVIRELKSQTDFIIVSVHGGAEGKNHQHLPKKDEVYLGYNRGNIYEFAHLCIDEGADIVFGHGPHVTRAIELYKNRFIAYSLGNFSTYKRFVIDGPNGIAPIIKLKVTSNGEFISGNIIPVKQIEPGITLYDDNKQVIKKIKELTNADFPNHQINFNDDGSFNSKP